MDDHFKLFDKIDIENKNNKLTSSSCELVKHCLHEKTITDKTIVICQQCGEEIESELFIEKIETPYMQIQDIDRYQRRKRELRTIYKDVEGLGFGERVVSLADNYYNLCTQNKIFRGNSRKAIIFACIFHAFKVLGSPQTCEQLISLFNLKRKIALRGLKFVNSNVPQNSPIKTVRIDPTHTLIQMLGKFDANDEQRDQVLQLYNQIIDKSSLLNQSRPQSTAAGLIFYYILKTDKQITVKEFVSKVNLSDLTIKKIVKELDRLLETNYYKLII